jgi:two-component system sensor histidine kinase AlgZ
VPSSDPSHRRASTFTRELGIALFIAVPATAYVIATNETASRALIVLHAAPLVVLTPLAVAVLDALAPRVAHEAEASLAPIVRDVGLHLAGLLLGSVGMVLTVRAITGLAVSSIVSGPLIVAMVPVFLAYALAATAGGWMRLREHALRVAANEARARQAALAARVRPHFLFNALNGIEELTDTDPAAARDAIGRLARLLRAVLEASAEPRARLGDEARLVDDYLAIERLRFGDRMAYDVIVPDALDDAEVPTTVLLTLAENAVKHGVEATPGDAKITIRADRADGGGIAIAVVSPRGEGRAPRAAAGLGYGLEDVRERLALAYGGDATLTLREEDGRVHVELHLPG